MEWIDRACAIAPDDPVTRQYAACVYARVGQTAAALECLEQAIAVGYRHREWIACEPDFEPLRGEERFRALMASGSRAALAAIPGGTANQVPVSLPRTTLLRRGNGRALRPVKS